ncbi:endonuclease/exonuclease/phosphatase family protein [Kribbella capetownensis]|uniref:Endonuclease/exonuclease/phosphatase family protein n=1 Tax=Kribbella capetownensis TaxID=1572659 RepID=A0A4R0IXT7_9ACTN|nr:endonuclease/exonuclease/phosphatase family protein [Kribbella capetownensis]TCC37454.1 endonuclease/exonuclease/phosphatase family protein [Kribbella capetownensis]
MRFMTWNVWGRFGDRWLRRQRAIAATVRAQRPEFVALQETWRVDGLTQATVLGAELGMASAFAPSRMPRDAHPGVRLGLGILSRFPFRAVERHKLSGDTVALRGEIRLGRRSLHFITSCLDWEEDRQRERLAQAQALATLVSELSGSGDRVVFAGDLNSPPGHPELEPLLDVLEDCWRPGEDGVGVTYSSHNRYLGRGEWLEDNRIDYILTRGGLVPRESHVLGFDEDRGLPPSDHYAVVADVLVA